MVQIITKNVPYSSILVDRIEMSFEFYWLDGQKLTSGRVRQFLLRILPPHRIFYPRRLDSLDGKAGHEFDACVRSTV